PAANVNVLLNGTTVFRGRFSGLTRADGTFLFDRVPAGGLNVNSRDSASPASSPTGSGVVAARPATTPRPERQRVGTVAGNVFAANGVTPVPGVSVSLSSNTIQLSVTSGVSGGFVFNTVPSGAYELTALVNGVVRSQASVQVTTQGATVTRNLVLS